MSEKVIKAALLGLGTVGSGVYKVLRNQKEEMPHKIGAVVEVEKILVRNLKKASAKVENPEILTNDWKTILEDESIEIVIEVMGGIEPARTYILEALNAGKHVVTANKDLVASHGQELLECAAEHNCDFLFEAAVAGGIPIIRPLHSSLTADEIDEISGILNGTTNYILSKMQAENADFEEVLKEAQEKGYAERNPEADVEGYDACRKIAILSSLAFGNHVNYEEIYTEGITKITVEDMKYASALGMSIKLLATSKKENDKFYAMVSPVLVGTDSPLYSVNDVFNAIFVHGNVLGDAMFYGSGAGKLPTASAVVGDVVDCAKHLHENVMTSWNSEKLDLMDIKEVVHPFLVRIKGKEAEMADAVKAVFGEVKTISVPDVEGEFAVITGPLSEAEYEAKAGKLPEIISRIRFKA